MNKNRLLEKQQSQQGRVQRPVLSLAEVQGLQNFSKSFCHSAPVSPLSGGMGEMTRAIQKGCELTETLLTSTLWLGNGFKFILNSISSFSARTFTSCPQLVSDSYTK